VRSARRAERSPKCTAGRALCGWRGTRPGFRSAFSTLRNSRRPPGTTDHGPTRARWVRSSARRRQGRTVILQGDAVILKGSAHRGPGNGRRPPGSAVLLESRAHRRPGSGRRLPGDAVILKGSAHRGPGNVRRPPGSAVLLESRAHRVPGNGRRRRCGRRKPALAAGLAEGTTLSAPGRPLSVPSSMLLAPSRTLSAPSSTLLASSSTLFPPSRAILTANSFWDFGIALVARQTCAERNESSPLHVGSRCRPGGTPQHQLPRTRLTRSRRSS
jgi:hypothetical protein